MVASAAFCCASCARRSASGTDGISGCPLRLYRNRATTGTTTIIASSGPAEGAGAGRLQASRRRRAGGAAPPAGPSRARWRRCGPRRGPGPARQAGHGAAPRPPRRARAAAPGGRSVHDRRRQCANGKHHTTAKPDHRRVNSARRMRSVSLKGVSVGRRCMRRAVSARPRPASTASTGVSHSAAVSALNGRAQPDEVAVARHHPGR